MLLLRVAAPPPGLQRGSKERIRSGPVPEERRGDPPRRARGDPEVGADPEAIPTIPDPPERGDCRPSPVYRQKEGTRRKRNQSKNNANSPLCPAKQPASKTHVGPALLSLRPPPSLPDDRCVASALEAVRPPRDEGLLALPMPLLLLRGLPVIVVFLRDPRREGVASVSALPVELPACVPSEIEAATAPGSVPSVAVVAPVAPAAAASSDVAAAAAAAAAPKDVPQSPTLQEEQEELDATGCGFCWQSSLLWHQRAGRQTTGEAVTPRSSKTCKTPKREKQRERETERDKGRRKETERKRERQTDREKQSP